MNAATEGFLLQLQAVDQALPGLVARLSASQFNWAPAPGRWSIGQCVEHLNLTTERYIPVLRTALGDARARGLRQSGPFALGFFERWFLQMLEPPPRRRIKTGKAFVAPVELDYASTLDRFRRLQDELAICIRESEGLDLTAIKVKSQFGPVRWSLNATFAILLAHERRHLWQAREVRTDRSFPAS
jgi:hypothetical protein